MKHRPIEDHALEEQTFTTAMALEMIHPRKTTVRQWIILTHLKNVSPSKIGGFSITGVWTQKWMFRNWFSGFHIACFLGSMLIFGGVKPLKKTHFFTFKMTPPPHFWMRNSNDWLIFIFFNHPLRKTQLEGLCPLLKNWTVLAKQFVCTFRKITFRTCFWCSTQQY